MFTLETFLVHIYMVILEWSLIYFIYSNYKPMDPRVSKKTLGWIFLVTGFIQAFFGAFEEFAVNVSVSAILFTLLAYFFFKKKIDIILSAVISTTVIDIGEGIAMMLTLNTYVTRKDLGDYMSESANTLFLFTFARFISYLIVLMLLKFKKIRDLDEDMPPIFWTTFLFIAMKDILLVIILNNSSMDISFYYWIAIIPIMPISYLFLFYTRRSIQNMIRNQVDSRLLDAKNDFYKQQLMTMEQTLETQKIVRHDLKNKLSPLIYFADNGMADDLIKQVKELGSLNMMGSTYSESGNITIDYIINLKLQELDNQDVDIECDVVVPQDIEIVPFDLSTILGNLIDNAIEALSYISGKKWLAIKISYQVGFLIIEVSNKFDGIVNLDGENIITKKYDKEQHGFGLSSVREITEKYDGEMIVNYNDSVFKVAIKLLV